MSIEEIKDRVTTLMQNEDHQLDSSHPKLCLPIIVRVYKKMLISAPFPAIKTNGRLIMDGHHRYIASLLSGYLLESAPYPKSSAKEQFDWKSVLIEDQDWEKPTDILRHNKLAAKHLEISLEELLERTK